MEMHWNSAGRRRLGAVGLLLLGLVGCASPGIPRPPSLHLPQPATGLRAERVGDQVLVSWRTAAVTTDGDAVRGVVTAVVCREVLADRAVRTACVPFARTVALAGENRAVDQLPAELLAEPPQVLGYRVELLNAAGRGAAAAGPVLAASGEAPPAVGAIRVSAAREGAVVEWTPVRTTAAMELRRTLVGDAAGVAPAAKTAVLPRVGGKRMAVAQFGSAKESATEVLLRAPGGQDEVGGLRDAGVKPLLQYTYTAQRVRAVTLGGVTLEVRGIASPPATFTFRDVFPPEAPSGLRTVPGGGFSGAPSIDLSWEPNGEADLLGYNVYRGEGAGFRRLNAKPLPGPAFRDLEVERGRTYVYRVTVVDQAGNESGASAEVREAVGR